MDWHGVILQIVLGVDLVLGHKWNLQNSNTVQMDTQQNLMYVEFLHFLA